MKIVVDGYGGDYAPVEIVKGCVLAVERIEDLKIVVTGKEQEIKDILKDANYQGDKIEIVNADDVISCEDANPALQIRRKPNSSLVKALEILKNDDEAVGLVSAGSTGAVLSGGLLKVGRIPGVSRPGLAPTLPTKTGKGVLLLDCGANADCKVINLCHFAIMGSIYWQEIHKVEKPRVALLSNGTEDAKGKELTKEAFKVLKTLPINFVGNMEARELLSGDYDVVIADGFAGNVALKTLEGTAAFMLGEIKDGIKSSFTSKLGALFMSKTFKRLKKTFDYKKHGGSLFLGCKKNIFKAHGNSKAEEFMITIKQAVDTAQNEVNSKIEKALSTIKIDVSED